MNNNTNPPTIKDVAKLSGVSIATVSRVINGGQKVRSEANERVTKAIEELQYTPNRAAQALVSKETKSIGVVVNNLHDPFFYDLLKGFEKGAEITSYNVVFCSVSSGAVDEKERYIKYLTNGVVDGIILYGSYLSDESLIKYVKSQTSCDFIIIENNIPEGSYNELLVDNTSGADSAVSYLYELGHRKIAHICGDLNKRISIERFSGFLQAMQNRRLIVESNYVQHATVDPQTGYTCMQNLLKLPEPPTAVFCSDDVLASNAIQAAMDMGLSVPEDISVVGFDNQRILPDAYAGPKITSIVQPLYDIAKDSILLLTERLQSSVPVEPLSKIYPTELIVKESTSPPKTKY